MVIVIAIIVVVVVVCVCASDSYKKKMQEKREAMASALAAQESFNATRSVQSPENEFSVYCLAVDDERKEVFCYSDSQWTRFGFGDIVAVELLADGKMTKVQDSNVRKELVTTIKVHVLLRNSGMDSFDVVCHDGPGAISTVSGLYKQVYGNAQNIYDILRLAMDEANASGATSSGASHTLKSCLEDLKDLAELKRQGLITDEEFDTLKAKILNGR